MKNILMPTVQYFFLPENSHYSKYLGNPSHLILVLGLTGTVTNMPTMQHHPLSKLRQYYVVTWWLAEMWWQRNMYDVDKGNMLDKGYVGLVAKILI